MAGPLPSQGPDGGERAVEHSAVGIGQRRVAQPADPVGGVVAPGGYQGEDLDVLAEAVLTRENPEVCAKVIEEIEATQDRETGDYSKVWAARDYVGQARKVRAAVMVVHGLNDWNVKVKNSVQWWNALKEAGVLSEEQAGPFGALAGLKDKLAKK